MAKTPLLPNESEVRFRPSLPFQVSWLKTAVLIYDRRLEKTVPGFKKWARRFPHRYPVVAGEGLKDLGGFPDHLERILRLTQDLPASQMTLVAVGGGSVGDFSGFLASILKRGVRLVHVPSTWLAALDSAHGGKTALNAGGVKNPIGTFYPANETYIVKSLLFSQPRERTREAFGELSKIALLDGRAWVGRMQASRLRNEKLIWKFLPEAIESKYRVVRKDPFEKRKIRRILNLGHTLGHVAEADQGIAHGKAVGEGLLFSLEWSARLGMLKKVEHQRIASWLGRQFGLVAFSSNLRAIPSSRFLALLKQDKKKDVSSGVQFVFLRTMGKAELRQVSWSELLQEAQRQGWVSRALR